ncbi:MAG TPA: metallophosphoesterase family protein [Herpetosiphonaceae bacterium]
MRIGVISDTHGTFHPAIPEHFAGVEQILHAGDIGKAEIIQRLSEIAPVLAVTGNVDWGGSLERHHPRVHRVELDGCAIYMTHIGGTPKELQGRLPTPRPDVYICGHSHIPLLQHENEVLFLNPGSAGPSRFGRKPSLAILTIEEGAASAELITLE